MIPEYAKTVTFWVSAKHLEKISQLIKEGKAENASVVVRTALAKYLDSF